MSVSRRGFLKGLATGAAGTLVAGTAKAGSTKHFEGHPGRFGLLLLHVVGRGHGQACPGHAGMARHGQCRASGQRQGLSLIHI